MAKFFDKDGNEVEAYTQEELKTHPEFKKLEDALTEANKKLTEGGGDMNASQKQRLKDQAAEAEKNLETFKKEMETKFASWQESMVTGTKTKILAQLSKGNKEVSDKIDLRFQSLMKTGEYQNNEQGIAQAMADAATLVNGARPAPSIMDNISGAGDRGAGGGEAGTKTQSTENEVAMRGVLGISEADVKKYADKIK